jgi:hypothetical protein
MAATPEWWYFKVFTVGFFQLTWEASLLTPYPAPEARPIQAF